MDFLSWFSSSGTKEDKETEKSTNSDTRKRITSIEDGDHDVLSHSSAKQQGGDEEDSEKTTTDENLGKRRCRSSSIEVELKDDEEEEKKDDESSDTDYEAAAETEAAAESPEVESEHPQADIPDDTNGSRQRRTKLSKSTRLRGYITLTLASFINYDTADNSSGDDFARVSVVPSTPDQRRYAVAVSLVSLVIAAACLIVHLDTITPLRGIWNMAFKPGSRWEGALLGFLTVWWTVATGVETSVSGIAGDGRGQFSIYYSSWVCCFTCYWMLERWLVAAGWASLKTFIGSWPNRSPAWICTAVLTVATLVWYLDLWRNHVHLKRDEEQLIVQHLGRVSSSQWRWLVFVTVATLVPSVVFSLAELVRGSNADGTINKKPPTETVVEGVCFLVLTVAWIPTVMMATTPRGAASLIGNSYFFTWIMAIVVVEGLVWFIHDKRQETYQALREKQEEYERRQARVAAQTELIQAKKEEQKNEAEARRDRTVSSDLFDMGAFRSAFSF